MKFYYQFCVCVIVLYQRVLCYRSSHNYESPPLGPMSRDRDQAADNFYKINYFISSLPNQGPYAEIMRDKEPPPLLPLYPWRLLDKRTVGTEFLGKRSEVIEDMDFDDPSLQKPCNQKNCLDK